MIKPAIIALGLLVFAMMLIPAHAASQSLVVSPRDTESLHFYLDEGDRMRFQITVNGGQNDDVNFTLKNPNGGIMNSGGIVSTFSDEFRASTSGTYYFEFDNHISLISSKQISFNYDIIKPPTLSATSAITGGSGVNLGSFLFLAIIVIIVVVPIAIWKKKKSSTKGYEYANKPSTQYKPVTKSVEEKQNQNSINILKERLAKGEVTKEEYDKLKKEFE